MCNERLSIHVFHLCSELVSGKLVHALSACREDLAMPGVLVASQLHFRNLKAMFVIINNLASIFHNPNTNAKMEFELP